MAQLTPETAKIESIVMQIHLLSLVLCLSDVHEYNCGEQNGEPMIFDLSVPSKLGLF